MRTNYRGPDILVAVGPGELSVDGTIEVWAMTSPADESYKDQIIDFWANPQGVIRYGSIVRSANSHYGTGVGGGDLYGNGGTLVPTAAGTIATLAHVYASTNGLVVSTAELADDATYEIAQAIASEPALIATVAKTGDWTLSRNRVAAAGGNILIVR